MRAINRKLVRDLRHTRGQAFAIALVVAAGTAMFVGYLATFESLRVAQRDYYARYRFADVFAAMRRAPASVVDRAAELPGVARAEGRIVVDVTLDLPETSEPATARLISMPLPRRPRLNDTLVRLGSDPERPDQVLVSEGFARARRLGPGDAVAAIVNGRRREFRISGLALSPEYIYGIRPGELMPDEARFGVFWIDERALAAAYDLTGGVNSLQIALAPRAIEADVIARLDALVEPYGGVGAFGRAQQVSHFFVDNELKQLQTFGFAIPSIFLIVAAFLLHVAMTRLLAVQREQVAALKALGYSNRELTVHFIEWALIVALAGGLLGTAAGIWLGSVITTLYNQFFHFPNLALRVPPAVVAEAFAIGAAAAAVGAARAVHHAVRVPPAEAMRPEAPVRYRETWIERSGLKRHLSQPARMVIRNIARQPTRAMTTTGGVAVALALLILGTFALDAIDVLIEQQFFVAQRQDVTVIFAERAPSRTAHDLAAIPGVLRVEPFLSVPVRFRHGQHSRLGAVTSVAPGATLSRPVSRDGRVVIPEGDGIALSDALAHALRAEPGDSIELDVLEGRRRTRPIVVARVVDEYIGTSAYMDLEALRRLSGAGEARSGAYVSVDERVASGIYQQLSDAPRVEAVNVKRAALETFQQTMAHTQYISILFNVLFAASIAAGVVYNAARVSLSERSRDLATLRVLGFTEAEIGGILFGELAVLTIVGMPLGLVLGYLGAWSLVGLLETELFRFPLAIANRTYAWSAIAIAAAAVGSALFVRRKLARLDLVAVLKSRE